MRLHSSLQRGLVTAVVAVSLVLSLAWWVQHPVAIAERLSLWMAADNFDRLHDFISTEQRWVLCVLHDDDLIRMPRTWSDRVAGRCSFQSELQISVERGQFRSEMLIDPSIPGVMLWRVDDHGSRVDDSPWIAYIAESNRTHTELVQLIYATVLNRVPSNGQLETSVGYLSEAQDRTMAARELVWQLITSAEFLKRVAHEPSN